jgi:alpha-beta hydrolase superfamily lysophospholipase
MNESAAERISIEGLAPGGGLDLDDVERDETYIDGTGGEELFLQSWNPAEGDVRGAVALMHGFGEHSSRYHHVAGALARVGWAVQAIDARGHGRSTGRRGHVEQYSDYVADFDRLVDRLRDQHPHLPLFALGHSNGGLIVLRHALGRRHDVTGYVVTSPMCGLAIDVPKVKSTAAKVFSKVWPTLALSTDLDPSHLSHIDAVVEAYRRDPLVHEVSTTRWFVEAMAAQRDLKERADTIEHPFLFLVAGDDKLCDPDATREVYHNLGSPDRDMEVFPNEYHEILNEPAWDEHVSRIVGWMTSQSSDAKAGTRG